MTLVHKSNGSHIGFKIFLSFPILFSIVKSRTIVYGFALASLGTFLISSGVKVPDFLILVRLIISVYFLALATYLYNDLTDYEVDKVNNRNNAYSSKKIRYQHILYSTVGFFAISILLAFSINMLTGIASLVCLGLAIVYSHPLFHLKDVFVIKTIVTSGGGFIASLMGALAVHNISYVGISSSIILFFMYFINGPLGDMSDISGDRKGGRRTIPIVIGIRKTFVVVTLSIVSIAVILLVNYRYFGLHVVGTMLGLAICISLILRIKKLSKQSESKEKITQTRTAVRISVFTIQISMFIGMALNTLSLL